MTIILIDNIFILFTYTSRECLHSHKANHGHTLYQNVSNHDLIKSKLEVWAHLSISHITDALPYPSTGTKMKNKRNFSHLAPEGLSFLIVHGLRLNLEPLPILGHNILMSHPSSLGQNRSLCLSLRDLPCLHPFCSLSKTPQPFAYLPAAYTPHAYNLTLGAPPPQSPPLPPPLSLSPDLAVLLWLS